ncbi:HAD family hydrolase [uncultured Roseobacter sp.]|uniref:HAD family hydrolase n=1 Tax=uncultured Roseobacter sp. TaxID=114847 RepID=UPI002616D2D5|nr:HAD family hydrolase [uncultured Roseobacter sp.]
MAAALHTVGFDADDTLWHNERFFQLTQAHFATLLTDYTERDGLLARLTDAEKRNLQHYGFGVKGFTLSMIETAIEVTDGEVSAQVISEILDAGREMLRHPVELLPDARETVQAVSRTHRTVLITKGDLLDQERKLAQSGLRDLFHGVEIVSDKTPQVYGEIFSRYGEGASGGLMIGNSMRSDVLPMIAAGGWGILLDHPYAWDYEHAPVPEPSARYHMLSCLAGLMPLIDQIEVDRKQGE